MSKPKINESVAAFPPGAKNHTADVETIQELLESAAKKTGNVAYNPKGIDGKIARPPRTSNSIKVIDVFQASFMAKPDLMIEPGKTAFQKLVTQWDAPFGSEPFYDVVLDHCLSRLGYSYLSNQG